MPKCILPVKTPPCFVSNSATSSVQLAFLTFALFLFRNFLEFHLTELPEVACQCFPPMPKVNGAECHGLPGSQSQRQQQRQPGTTLENLSLKFVLRILNCDFTLRTD